jgi:hypothetical protein
VTFPNLGARCNATPYIYNLELNSYSKWNSTPKTHAIEDQMNGTTVLLTGVTGYVGSELARQLLQAGAHLRCPVRCALDSPRLSALKEAFEGLPGTITFLVSGFISFDGKIHCGR